MIVATALEASEAKFRESLARRNEQLTVTKQAIVELAERTAEVGVFARELQIIVGEKRFDVWFTEQGFDCTLAQAKSFMRFAEKRQALSDSFRRTLLALPGVADSASARTACSGSCRRPNASGCPPS